MNDTKQALEAVVGLVGKAEQGEWHMYGGTNHARVQTDDVIVCDGSAPHFMQPEDARAIAAAVNLIRTHGPALLAALEDARRMDYIERTYSGMTNRERYLPVTMGWGAPCNGRTLREACDKYMRRDAAIDAAQEVG